MAELYNMAKHRVITKIVESCELDREINQIVNYARDGTIYIQTLNDSKKNYNVICHTIRPNQNHLEDAWADGDLIRITTRVQFYDISELTPGIPQYFDVDKICYGYIIGMEKELIPGVFDGTVWQDYFKVKLTLAYAPAPVTS